MQESESDLSRFEALLERCERIGRSRLTFDELRSLGQLYRLHAASLARERHRGNDPEATRFLNALCIRAYTTLHAGGPRPTAPRAARLRALRDALGRTWRAQAAAWLLLASGGLLGALVAAGDPTTVPALIPSSLGYTQADVDGLASSPEARIRFLAREETAPAENAIFGSMLFARNTRVGLLAFATGILAGVPTVLLQVYNGLLLGSFAWIFLRGPEALTFLAWILPHGVPELTAITLCAAGGLTLGNAVAAPGRQGRRRALREAQGPSLLLFTCSLPLFALAAVMESFVRESLWSSSTRLGVAAFEVTLLGVGLFFLWRLSERKAPDTRWLRASTESDQAASARSAR